ncbi:MAG: aminopeptidase, partial [Lachnospiraceae bacterium]|nr:aminopeptidase [Lachnospiraceae bacterium]
RIEGILEEKTVSAPFCIYFQAVAKFLLETKALREKLVPEKAEAYTLEEWQQINYEMYADILPEHYAQSFGNPEYAVETLGEVFGKLLSFLYTELRALQIYVYEERLEETVICLELFIEVYNCFERTPLPEYREIQQVIYWFLSDYSELFVARRIQEAIDPELDFATRIVMESDLTDLRYLYRYGEYVSENELKTAEFLNTLSEEEIAAMADTYTEGYRIGFVLGGKDLSIKRTVNIRYQLGFERMIRKAIGNFAKMGLKPVIYRAAVSTLNKRQTMRIGYSGAVPNKQFEYDHRADNAVYLDKKFAERKLGVMRTSYEKWKQLAAWHAGPAVVETFGETPFVPKSNPYSYQLSEKQQKLQVSCDNESAQITNQYIIGKERSFTIIAFPVPEIGAQFEDIFRETVRINTLDYALYRDIQQKLIDVLDQGTSVHIRGAHGNETDLTVALHPLQDPAKETLFENCVADVNIPVGEVFTSPQLAGTNGLLHVSQVYLNELKYVELKVWFKDGRIENWSCGNFADDEANRNYFFENVMYHHETLPLGEFAIGTNTAAYCMAQKYQIADKLPILIAEKMGPHFAVGDTCYSWAEDTPVYNPDGKEIIARDNEVSLLRKEDPSRAYFGCHTDITIPYEELGSIEVIRADGSRIPVISGGRFVVPGTEVLNESLDEAGK